MKKKIKIVYDQALCINCSNCVINCPKFFEEKNGLTGLKNSRENNNKFELETEVDEDDLSLLEQAARFCPVKTIDIQKD